MVRQTHEGALQLHARQRRGPWTRPFCDAADRGRRRQFEITGPLAGDQHFDTLRPDRSGNEFIGYGAISLGIPATPANGPHGSADWGPDAGIGEAWLAVTSHQGCDVTTITFED
jgi:hypothetical protein